MKKSGGLIQVEKLQLIRKHWFGGVCMGKGCTRTFDLELAHAIQTKLSKVKHSARSSYERLKDVMKYPERFLLLCSECHRIFDDRTTDQWLDDYIKQKSGTRK